MTSEVVTIRNAATVAAAIDLMQQRNVHALIVLPNDVHDAYGIVTVSDVVGRVIAFGRDPKQMRVYEIMTKPCIVLNPNLRIEYAARLLTQYHLHSAPVIQSKLLGILSISDILRHSSDREKPQSLELADSVRSLTTTARQICKDHGPGSTACANAWLAVDTLQAELSRQKSEPLKLTASEQYWQDYQNTIQDQEYNEWCSG
ncbi:MAG: CBS domain-containing protein [Cyanobacteria bacterium P01_D01_bin.1]